MLLKNISSDDGDKFLTGEIKTTRSLNNTRIVYFKIKYN